MNLSYTPEPETLKTKIIIERGAARELKRYIEPKGARRAAVVTDKNVYALYAPEITAALEETGWRRIFMPLNLERPPRLFKLLRIYMIFSALQA